MKSLSLTVEIDFIFFHQREIDYISGVQIEIFIFHFYGLLVVDHMVFAFLCVNMTLFFKNLKIKV